MISTAIYLAACFLLPWAVAHRVGRPAPEWPAVVTVGFALFFLPLQALGLAGMFYGDALLKPGSALAVVVVIAIATGLGLRRASATPIDASRLPRDKLNWPTRLTVVGVFATFLVLAVALTFGYPRGFEPHAYHLPIGVHMFQTGSLELWDMAYMHAFPGNQSLYAGLLLQWLPERIVSAANLPYLAICCCAAALLAVRAGADRSAAALTAAGLTTIPIFGFSSLELGSDLGGVAFVCLSSYFVIARPNVPTGWAFLGGIAAGLAFGFKSLHLVTAGFLGLVCMLPLASSSATLRPLQRVRQGVIFGVGALLTGSAWLLRNYFETGNPLYPLHFDPLFTWLGFPAAPDFQIASRAYTEQEWVPSAAHWLAYPWVEGHFIDQNFKHSSGLGMFFASAVPVSAAIVAYDSWLTLRRHSPRTTASINRICIYFTAVFVFVVWWILGDRQPRYTMAGIAMLVPATAWVLTQAIGRPRQVLDWIWGSGVLLMSVVLLTKLGAEIGSRLSESTSVRRFEVMEYPPEVDNLPRGANILNMVERPHNYRLFGSHLSNRVVSFSETRRNFFDPKSATWLLDGDELTKSGPTYVYASSKTRLVVPSNVELAVAGTLDKNPYNGVPLPDPLVLYVIRRSVPDQHP